MVKKRGKGKDGGARAERAEMETLSASFYVCFGCVWKATTPMDPRVLDEMLPYMVSKYGNPHSKSHYYGWDSETAVEKARKEIADLIGADPKEIIITSGATESNNLALKGVANFYKEKKNHIITTQTEHKCVLDSCRYLQQHGFEVTYLPVNSVSSKSKKSLHNREPRLLKKAAFRMKEQMSSHFRLHTPSQREKKGSNSLLLRLFAYLSWQRRKKLSQRTCTRLVSI